METWNTPEGDMDDARFPENIAGNVSNRLLRPQDITSSDRRMFMPVEDNFCSKEKELGKKTFF